MPPTQTLHFDPAGGALQARASAGQAAPGSYSLLVFERDGLTLVPPSPFDADFGGAAANTHALPGSAAGNDGRILDLVYSVGLMDATRAFAVHLTLLQDGRVLGTASDTGTDTGTEETHKGQLLVVIAAAAPTVTTPRVPAAAKRLAAVDRAARAQVGAADTAPPDAAKRAPAKRGATKQSDQEERDEGGHDEGGHDEAGRDEARRDEATG